MKKDLLKAAIVAAFAAVAGYGVYANQKEEVTLSDNALANVEALARFEATIKCCACFWGDCEDQKAGPYIECTIQ